MVENVQLYIVILVCSIHSTHETIDCFNGFFLERSEGAGIILWNIETHFKLLYASKDHSITPWRASFNNNAIIQLQKGFLLWSTYPTYFKISIKYFSFWKRLVWNCIIICTFIFAMDLNFFASYPTFTSLYSMIYTYVFVYSLATSYLVYNLNGNAYHSNVWIRYK